MNLSSVTGFGPLTPTTSTTARQWSDSDRAFFAGKAGGGAAG
jgi:hypothetical protein